MAEKKCPKCGRLWGENDYFCGLCGTRLVVVETVELEETEEPDSAARKALTWFFELFPGLASPKVIIASGAAFVVAFLAFTLAVFMLSLGVAITAFAAGGGGIIMYWAGLSWLLYGYVCSPVEAMAEFESKHWMAFVIATCLPGGLLILFAKLASMAQEAAR